MHLARFVEASVSPPGYLFFPEVIEVTEKMAMVDGISGTAAVKL